MNRSRSFVTGLDRALRRAVLPVAQVLLWLFLLVKAWQGETWRVPIVGSLAARLAQA